MTIFKQINSGAAGFRAGSTRPGVDQSRWRETRKNASSRALRESPFLWARHRQIGPTTTGLRADCKRWILVIDHTLDITIIRLPRYDGSAGVSCPPGDRPFPFGTKTPLTTNFLFRLVPSLTSTRSPRH